MSSAKAALKRVLYPAYEARLVRRLRDAELPQHVGVMLDGNRRWARAAGASTAAGHRAGAANIAPLLEWAARDEAEGHGEPPEEDDLP